MKDVKAITQTFLFPFIFDGPDAHDVDGMLAPFALRSKGR